MALKKMPARAPGLSGEARMLTKMATVKKQEQQRLFWVGIFFQGGVICTPFFFGFEGGNLKCTTSNNFQQYFLGWKFSIWFTMSMVPYLNGFPKVYVVFSFAIYIYVQTTKNFPKEISLRVIHTCCAQYCVCVWRYKPCLFNKTVCFGAQKKCFDAIAANKTPLLRKPLRVLVSETTSFETTRCIFDAILWCHGHLDLHGCGAQNHSEKYYNLPLPTTTITPTPLCNYGLGACWLISLLKIIMALVVAGEKSSAVLHGACSWPRWCPAA